MPAGPMLGPAQIGPVQQVVPRAGAGPETSSSTSTPGAPGGPAAADGPSPIGVPPGAVPIWAGPDAAGVAPRDVGVATVVAPSDTFPPAQP